MKPADLDIRLLGNLEVRRGGRPVPLPRSKKTRALLGYLVATGRPHSREKLCDLLYEGSSDPRAGLRWSLSKLRPLFEGDGATRIVTTDDQILVNLHGVTVDIAVVRKAASPDPKMAATETLRTASSRFRGDLLEGLDLSGCYGFDAWRTAEREAIRRLREAVLDVLVDRLRDRPEEALPYARDRLVSDPLSEAAHINFVRLLAAMGRKDEALEQYERCHRMLEVEFKARPSREMENLRRSLAGVRSTPVSSLAKWCTSSSALPPLVGRRNEKAILNRFTEPENRETPGEVLLLTGAPGIGKTRLLQELKNLTDEAGGTVLMGCAFDIERVRPYTAWIDALRSVALDRIPQELHGELAPLFPELGPASEEETDRNRLFDAVFRLLKNLAGDEPPVCVLLDDLHWCDESSAALTHYIARAATGIDLRLAGAVRSAAWEDNEAARRLIHTLRRERRLRRIDLAPLTVTDTVELVRHVDRRLDADRIFTESEGNPLFALEVARAFQQGKDPISDTLDGLIVERFSMLGTRAREIIPWVATLGRACTVEFLSRLTQTAPHELLDAMEELERHELVQTNASGGCDFTHDLVRRAAYRNISEARRRLNHLEIARTIAGTGDLDGATAGEVAHHASLGGDRELAARAFAAAGRHSLRVCAFDETAVLAERGLEHIPGLQPPERIRFHLELLALYVHPDMARLCPSDFQERLRQVTGEAKAIGDRALISRGFRLFGWLHYHRGDFSGAFKATFNAQEAGREADPVTVVQAIAETSHCLCLLERDMKRAEKLAREAQSLANEFDVKIDGFELPLARGMLRQHAGALDEAYRLIEEAFQCSRHNRFPWAQTHCLSRLIMVELERKRPDDALAWCRELRLMTANLDEGSEAPFATALEGLARLSLGDERAGTDLEQAVERLRQVDSKWMLAYVQNEAATHDLAAGKPDEARRRAEDARAAAEAVQRRSEIALARATLAGVALRTDRLKDAADFPQFAKGELKKDGVLSARARRGVEQVARAMGG